MTRVRFFSVAMLALPLALGAQQAPHGRPVHGDPTTVSFAFITAWFSGLLMRAFDSIPAAMYEYKPTPPQQSVGYIAQHLEEANYSLCERLGVLRRAPTAKDSLADTIKAHWPKDTLTARLGASFRFCDRAMTQVNDANLGDRVDVGPPGSGSSFVRARSLVLFVTDLAEHYSQIAVYMRLNGMVPPSKLPAQPRFAISVPAAELARYAGTYDLAPSLLLDRPRTLVDIVMRDGALFIKPRGQPEARLWPETSTAFFLKEIDAQVTFTRDRSGSVTGLVVHQLGEDRTAKKLGDSRGPTGG